MTRLIRRRPVGVREPGRRQVLQTQTERRCIGKPGHFQGPVKSRLRALPYIDMPSNVAIARRHDRENALLQPTRS
jgi:hypothetical protein